LKKLKTLAQLREIVGRERKNGRTIVLANGGFDLLHAGHVRYLQAAKNCGDVLIVALNSDSSIRRLKGKGRPILPQSERADILSAFECVDYLTIFKEPNVERILKVLKPDIHAKGSDYTKKTVPEQKTVLAYGGRIAIAGGPKIRSTSEVIPRILAKLKKRGRAARG
jgi:rfaE bifunctional protein nucleotidyltransferase chain/domain